MLRELMIRDLVLSRRPLLLNGGVAAAFLVYSSLSVSSPHAYAVFAALMMLFLPIVISTREDLAKAMASTCALPVSRVEVVRARFLLSWLLSLAGLAVALAIGTFVPGSAVRGGVLLEVGNIALALTVVILASALLLPLVIRLGFMGVIACLVAAQGLGIVLMLLTMSGAGAAGRRSLRDGLARLASQIAAARTQAGEPLFFAGLAAALVVASYLSYRVGVALLRRREL